MYLFKPSNKAKHLRVSIHPGGGVVVTIPKKTPEEIVEKFLQEKRAWIEQKVNLMSKYQKIARIKLSRNEKISLKQKARFFVEEKLNIFNTIYKYSWNTITIREQKTRWGSCSRKGNLNFNYRIALLPEKLAEYIVVHELCHLGEFNHSSKFWDLVEKTIPDYKQRRIGLKTTGIFFQ